MAILASWLYRDGRRVRALALDEAFDAADGAQFAWIDLADPQPGELAALQRAYQLHPMTIEAIRERDRPPMLEAHDGRLFLVAFTAHLESDKIGYGQIAMFVARNCIITMRLGSRLAHEPLRQALEAEPGLLAAQGVGYVLYALLGAAVDTYLPVVTSIEDELKKMEQRSLDSFLRRNEIKRIFSLRRQLTRFQRMLMQTESFARKLAMDDLPGIAPGIRPYFGDVHDTVRQSSSMVIDLREVVASVFEFANMMEQQRTGAVTRQLAAWAAVLAVPTAIAGIYGMNFKNMPELESPYGYFAVMAAITAICAALYWRFRRAGWL